MASLMLKDELPLVAECGLEQPHLLGETGKYRKTGTLFHVVQFCQKTRY